MLQVLGRSLSVSVNVLKWVFTFQLQSDSSANKFRISSFFYTTDFVVYETTNISNAQQYLLMHSMFFNI